jgi:hypothetical protein
LEIDHGQSDENEEANKDHKNEKAHHLRVLNLWKGYQDAFSSVLSDQD